MDFIDLMRARDHARDEYLDAVHENDVRAAELKVQYELAQAAVDEEIRKPKR